MITSGLYTGHNSEEKANLSAPVENVPKQNRLVNILGARNRDFPEGRGEFDQLSVPGSQLTLAATASIPLLPSHLPRPSPTGSQAYGKWPASRGSLTGSWRRRALLSPPAPPQSACGRARCPFRDADSGRPPAPPVQL